MDDQSFITSRTGLLLEESLRPDNAENKSEPSLLKMRAKHGKLMVNPFGVVSLNELLLFLEDGEDSSVHVLTLVELFLVRTANSHHIAFSQSIFYLLERSFSKAFSDDLSFVSRDVVSFLFLTNLFSSITNRGVHTVAVADRGNEGVATAGISLFDGCCPSTSYCD